MDNSYYQSSKAVEIMLLKRSYSSLPAWKLELAKPISGQCSLFIPPPPPPKT